MYAFRTPGQLSDKERHRLVVVWMAAFLAMSLVLYAAISEYPPGHRRSLFVIGCVLAIIWLAMARRVYQLLNYPHRYRTWHYRQLYDRLKEERMSVQSLLRQLPGSRLLWHWRIRSLRQEGLLRLSFGAIWISPERLDEFDSLTCEQSEQLEPTLQ